MVIVSRFYCNTIFRKCSIAQLRKINAIWMRRSEWNIPQIIIKFHWLIGQQYTHLMWYVTVLGSIHFTYLSVFNLLRKPIWDRLLVRLTTKWFEHESFSMQQIYKLEIPALKFIDGWNPCFCRIGIFKFVWIKSKSTTYTEWWKH